MANSSSGDDVPPFFKCPISLEIMKDPVTISTGMTFDRNSILKWLFIYGHNTCPITNQTLTDHSLIPNSNLLRSIQSWTPPIHNQNHASDSKTQPLLSHIKLSQLVQHLKQSTSSQQKKCILRNIKLAIQENEEHREFVVNSDVASLVASQLVLETEYKDEAWVEDHDQSWEIIEEAVSFLDSAKLPAEKLKMLAQDKDGKMIALLASIIVQQPRSYQARIQAASLLKSIFRIVEGDYKSELKMELFEGLAEILKDQNSVRGSKAGLSILIEILPHGVNRRKAVQAGIVSILVELLSETNERRMCEIILHVLNQLCKVAEGRVAFMDHPVAVAAVCSKILRISHHANDCAVSVLGLLFRFSETSTVAKEFFEVGGVARMSTLIQTVSSSRTKEKARAILGFYHRSSIDYNPCLPSRFNIA